MANGKVYVASYMELDIFGIHLRHGEKAVSRTMAHARVEKLEYAKGREEHQISGTVRKVEGNHFTIETREHKMVEVDASKARESLRYPVIAIGNGVRCFPTESR